MNDDKDYRPYWHYIGDTHGPEYATFFDINEDEWVGVYPTGDGYRAKKYVRGHGMVILWDEMPTGVTDLEQAKAVALMIAKMF